MRVPDDPETRAAGSAKETREAHPVKEILNIEEASAFLSVSSKTFQKVLREGDMPGRKVGREWKFWRQALAEWVGRGKSRDFLDSSDREGSGASDSSQAAAPAHATPTMTPGMTTPLAKRAAAGANGARPSGATRPGTAHRSLEAEED